MHEWLMEIATSRLIDLHPLSPPHRLPHTRYCNNRNNRPTALTIISF